MKRILLLDFGSNKVPQLEAVVGQYADFQTVSFSVFQDAILADFNGVIFSGAPILLTEDDISHYITALSWVKTTPLPVLGICFGHQLLGILFNAHVARMKECRSLNEIEHFVDCPLLLHIPRVFEMQEDHCESISIPEEFELVANSDECVNEVMQHVSKKLFGVQFHPEVSGTHGAILIENFIRIC